MLLARATSGCISIVLRCKEVVGAAGIRPAAGHDALTVRKGSCARPSGRGWGLWAGQPYAKHSIAVGGDDVWLRQRADRRSVRCLIGLCEMDGSRDRNLDHVTYASFGIDPVKFYAGKFDTGPQSGSTDLLAKPDARFSISYDRARFLCSEIVGPTVLDVGCGSGPYAATIRKHTSACRLVGVDLDKTCVASARKVYDEAQVFSLNARLPFVAYVHMEGHVGIETAGELKQHWSRHSVRTACDIPRGRRSRLCSTHQDLQPRSDQRSRGGFGLGIIAAEGERAQGRPHLARAG